MYKVVFLDIDGTIYDEINHIPASTYEAVRKLQEKGVHVVIATGRSYQQSLHATSELNISSIVAFNGSYVKDEEEEILKETFTYNDIKKIHRMGEEQDISVFYSSLTDKFRNNVDHKRIGMYESFFGYRPKVTNTPWNSDVLGMNFFGSRKKIETVFKKEFQNLSFYFWDDEGCDVAYSHISKASGIKAYLDKYGFEVSEAVAFGDGSNDKEMLSFVGMGVMMGNGIEELKQYADFITTDASDNGIYNGLKKIGLI